MHVPEVSPDPPGPAWRGVLSLLERLPQATLSRGLGHLADLPIPALLRRPVLTAFARALGIDVSEAEKPITRYRTLNDFFVRRLRRGSRSWPREPGLTSPVDGLVGQVGLVDRGRIVQAKGRSYAAGELLGDPEVARSFEGGVFVTLYLAPRHYHRVHAPIGGGVARARYVPGSLLPVNDAAVREVERLFARNERLYCVIEGGIGRVAMAAVGAYNVGRISTSFDPAWAGREDRPWVTNRKAELPRERSYDPPLAIERGQEMMAFHLGSTVILLLEPERFTLVPRCVPGLELQVGELLARPNPQRGAT